MKEGRAQKVTFGALHVEFKVASMISWQGVFHEERNNTNWSAIVEGLVSSRSWSDFEDLHRAIEYVTLGTTCMCRKANF